MRKTKNWSNNLRAGIPKDLPEYVKESKTKIAPIVSSLRCCKLIVEHWRKKYNYIPDMIIIEGPEAGGHLGFKEEELGEDKPKLEQITTDVVSYMQYSKQSILYNKSAYKCSEGKYWKWISILWKQCV